MGCSKIGETANQFLVRSRHQGYAEVSSDWVSWRGLAMPTSCLPPSGASGCVCETGCGESIYTMETDKRYTQIRMFFYRRASYYIFASTPPIGIPLWLFVF